MIRVTIHDVCTLLCLSATDFARSWGDCVCCVGLCVPQKTASSGSSQTQPDDGLQSILGIPSHPTVHVLRHLPSSACTLLVNVLLILLILLRHLGLCQAGKSKHAMAALGVDLWVHGGSKFGTFGGGSECECAFQHIVHVPW